MPCDKAAIDAAFPHRRDDGGPAYRRHQFETIRDVLACLDDGSVDDVVVEAPTGAGKTSIAVTVARVASLGHGRALKSLRSSGIKPDSPVFQETLAPHQVHMITSMKMLQDAYLGDDPGIALIKGKSNYTCGRSGGGSRLSCGETERLFGRRCEGRCAYGLARAKAAIAAITLHNFDGFFYQASLGRGFWPRRLLTLDEAHNAEEKLRSFCTITVARKDMTKLSIPWREPGTLDDMSVVGDWASAYVGDLSRVLKSLGEKISAARSRGLVSSIVEARELVSMARGAERVLGLLSRFVSSLSVKKPALWVAHRPSGGGSIVIEPVEAGRFAKSVLFSFGKKRLHLSATFLDGSGSYSRAVRLRSVKKIQVPSTFPAANRPLIPMPAGPLGQRDWKENFPRVVSGLREILSLHPGQKGLVHVTSYAMANEIKETMGVDGDRLVVFGRGDKAGVVGKFMSGDGDSVLLAVGMSEGYDMKYDMCRFQVIVRLPYQVPTDLVKARMAIDGNYYGWRTCLSLVQQYGRGTRAADDYCTTYVLDGRFKKFISRERKQLPAWFMEAVNGGR